MKELKIIAVITAKDEYKKDVLSAIYQVVDETRKEEGNISYELHEDTNNPLKLTILEVWKSQDAIDYHNSSTHFNAFKEAINGKIDNLEINVIQKIY